jgi:perosamine synthetase
MRPDEGDKIVAQRQAMAKLYGSKLSKISSVSTQAIHSMSSTAWQAYVVRIAGKDPKDVIKALKDQGIEANIGTYALHILKYYSEKYGYKPSDMPNALELFKTCVALPFYNSLSNESIAEVEAALKEYV